MIRLSETGSDRCRGHRKAGEAMIRRSETGVVTGAEGIVKRVKRRASISSIAFARHSTALSAPKRRKS